MNQNRKSSTSARSALIAGLSISAFVTGCGGVPGFAHAANQAPASATVVAAQDQAVFQSMRARWLDFITGGDLDLTDPDIKARVSAISDTAKTRQQTLNRAVDRTYLWTDLQDWSRSATMRSCYLRVLDMALAYGTKGSTLKGDPALAADILAALDWLYANKYNENVKQYGNWWEWSIGNPRALDDILTLMYDRLTPEQLAQNLRAMDHFNPHPTHGDPGTSTGANLLDKATGVALSGMLAGDASKIVLARKAMQAVYDTVTEGDGFYADGSFIQHKFIAYMGGYGQELVTAVSKLAHLTQGTPWAFPAQELAKTYSWFDDSIAPLIYRGAIMDAVRGRKVARSNESDHVNGRNVIIALRRIADMAEPAKAAQINALVKGWIQADTTFASYFDGLSLYDLPRVKALLADPAVAGSALTTTRVYGSMARAVHLTPGFGFGLSMFSDRVSAFTYGNGENKKGWLTGAGMTAVYTDDLTQFAGNYWATVDHKRLPGTTVDGVDFGAPVDWAFYGNPIGVNWTGGSSVMGAYASTGMELAMSGFLSREQVQGAAGTTGRTSPSTLSGKKSWFMMGDKIIAIGSDLKDDGGRRVETIVENRKLNAAGDNALTVDGKPVAAPLGSGSQALKPVTWAHLAGNGGSAAGLGYYFPTPTRLDVLREQRTGAWTDVRTAGPAGSVSDSYLSLAIGHGVNPTAAGYAYVLLPNQTAQAVAKAAARPDVQVLSTSGGVHAVRYNPPASATQPVKTVIGANFWLADGGAVTLGKNPLLTSSAKASITMAETARQLSIGIADPTEANTGTVTLEINRSAKSAGTLDPAVKVLQLKPTIRLEVDVSNARGRSIQANLNL